MAQRYAPLPSLLFTALSALLAGPLSAQVLVDNFNRANNTTVGGGWTETESSGTSSCQISGNELLMGGTTAGRDFVAQNTPGTYNTTLTNNTCNLTWAFNMRQSRTDPSGFAAGNYGVAVVLAGTNSDLTQGNGYAVVLGNTGATDPLRLVRYTGGLDTNANIQNILTASDFGNNYLDVRVTYNPLTDTWGLFYTDNGAAGPFGDPLVAATSAGTTVDATYTGVSAPVIGCLWNHNTAGADNARFDNFYVPSACTTTVQFTGSAASVSESGVSTTLTVSITNPDAINATTADVVLTAGTASRIGNYTTQTVTFPAGSSANQTVTVTLTDNGACDGNEVFTFQLQNVAGGNSATAGTPSTFTLTLTDNELTSVTLLTEDFETDGSGTRYTLGYPEGNPASGDLFLRSNDAGMTAAGGLAMAGESGSFYMEAEDMDLVAPSATNVVDLTGLDIQGVANVTISLLAGARAAANYDNGGLNTDFLFVERNVDGGGWVTVGAFRSEATIGNSNQRIALDTDLNGVGDGTQLSATMAPFTFAVGATGSSLDVRIRFRSDADNEEIAFDLIEVKGDLCRPIYYTRANGDQTTATWSTTRTGTASAVTFDKNATAVVQNGHTVTATGADWTVYNLDVEAGGSVVMGTTDLEHYGTALTNNNSFTIGTGAVTFRNPGAVTLGGSGTYDLYDLTANNADVTLTSSLLRIRRTLDMTNGGTFNANNTGNPARVLELHSDANGTGRIGPMSAGPSFTGQVDMERYVPGGVTNWRLISAPTNNNQLSSLEDDFVTAGYPGSEFPLFDDPPGSNILWPSIRTYDETDAGATLIDGLTGATGDNMVMAMGQGFAAWSGTGLQTTSPFTIDLRSGVRNALTPLNLPVTYTNTGNATVDGWNLVGNPLPSPIDFSLLALTNVDNYYYVFDPVSGNNATWDEGLGLSIPGGSLNGNIQSFQGFWVKANAATPAVTVEETDKVLDLNGGGLFGGSQQGAPPMFRLELSNAMNAFFDETVVHFGTGGPASGDAHDLIKFTFSHPEAPQVMTRTSDGEDMTLNAWGPLTGATSIEVPIDVGVTGSYTLRVYDALGIMGQTCLVLEDLQTGQSTALTEGATYTFTADANDPVLPARFVVHTSAPVQHTATDVTCHGAANGSASALGAGTGPWDYTWATDGGTVLLTQSQLNGAGQIAQLPAGDYLVTVSSQAGCGDLTHAFRIDEPALLDAALTATGTSCAAVSDGAVDLMVMGGTEPHSFAWDNGATSEDLANVAAGTYTVTVTDANGCTTAPLQATVATGTGPNAAFLPSTTSTFTGEPVEFFNLSTWGAQVNWDFGDGTGSTDNEPIHTYAVPGTYTVTLTVTLDGCTAVSIQEVVVDVSTGIAPVADDLARVWLDDQHVVVDLQQQRADEVVITMLDAAGRVVAERRMAMSSTRERIPVDHVAGGVILVRLLTADQGRTYKLPLSR